MTANKTLNQGKLEWGVDCRRSLAEFSGITEICDFVLTPKEG